MEEQEQLKEALAQFYGTEKFYSIAMIKTRFTDGIKYLAEQTNCFWLVTDTSIMAKSLMDKSCFITIDFKKNLNEERNISCPDAVITYGDGNGHDLCSQEYYVTDFPFDELRLFFVDGTLMLPGEY